VAAFGICNMEHANKLAVIDKSDVGMAKKNLSYKDNSQRKRATTEIAEVEDDGDVLYGVVEMLELVIANCKQSSKFGWLKLHSRVLKICISI
jgi:hypothetical protein